MKTELAMLKEFQDALTLQLTKSDFHDISILHKTGNLLSDLTAEGETNYLDYLDQTEFCMDLISEEFDELADSLDSVVLHDNGEKDKYIPDSGHMLKEVCDLLYVTLGFASRYVEFEKLPEAFKRVHENNMLKISNGTINSMGKLVKQKDHPKVDLSDLVVGNNPKKTLATLNNFHRS
jgi:hypothetical protein